MVTLAKRGAGTPVTSGATWTTVTNAVDGAPGSNPATYAVFTNAASGAVGYIEISGYDFSAISAATDTLNSVTVSIRHLVAATARWSKVEYQAWSGGVALGTIRAGTLANAARNDSGTFACTLAQLQAPTFKVRVTFTRAAVTQSSTASLDYADVTADYSPPLKSGTAGPVSHSWATTAVGVKPAPPVIVKAETLTDTFDTSIDPAKWPYSVRTVWESGRVRLSSEVDTEDASMQSRSLYDLAGSRIFAKVVPPTLEAGAYTYMMFRTQPVTPFNLTTIGVEGFNLLVDQRAAGGAYTILKTIPYDPVAHAWWQLRESNGTIYAETSPDSITWNVVVTTPTALYSALSPGFLEFDAGRSNGSGAKPGSYAYVDNVNVPRPSVFTDDFTGTGALDPGSWTTGGFQVASRVSDQFASNGDYGFACLTGYALGSGGQYAEATKTTAGSVQFGLSSTTTVWEYPGTANGYFILSRSDGVAEAFTHGTSLGYSFITTAPIGCRIRAEHDGAGNLKLLHDDVVVKEWDDPGTAWTGPYAWFNVSPDTARADDYEAGNLSAGGAPGKGTTAVAWASVITAVGAAPLPIPPDARLDEAGTQRVTENGTARLLEDELSQVTGLVGWWDAADMGMPSAGAVSQLSDKSGKGFHLTQPTAEMQPTISARPNMNGHKALSFEANGNLLYTGTTNLNVGSVTVFVVAADRTSNNIYRGLFGAHPTTGNDYDSPNAFVVETGVTWMNFDRAGAAGISRPPGGTEDPPLTVWSCDYRPDGTIQPFMNGVAGTPATFARTFGVANGGWLMGGRFEGGVPTTASYFRGEIGEVLVYDRVLSSAERRQVEAYLEGKWFSVVPPPVVPREGTAAVTYTESVTAVGKEVARGAAAVAWSESVVAVGKRAPQATSAVTYTSTVTAIGKRTTKATAAVTYTESVTAVGKRAPKATSVTTWTESVTTAVGKRTPRATTAVTYTESVTGATGKRTPKAATTAAHTWITAAQGVAPAVGVKQGTAAVAWSEGVTTVGKETPKATSSVTYTETVTAAGKKLQKAITAVTWSETSVVVGKRVPQGACALTTTDTITAAGKRSPRAVTTAATNWVVAANGVTPLVGVKQGTAAVTYSSAVTVVGKRVAKSGSTTTYSFPIAAAGKKAQRGSAAVTYTETTAAVGKRVARAVAAVTYSETLGAVGKRAPKATASPITYNWALLALGSRPIVGGKQGFAAVTYSVVTAANGKRTVRGSAAVTYSWATTAAGKKLQRGTAATSHLWTPAGVGKRRPKGLIVVSYEIAVTASGKLSPKGRADTTTHEWTVVIMGLTGIAGVFEGWWNGQEIVEMQYGDKPVIDWAMVPA
jgi:hypothetical protein